MSRRNNPYNQFPVSSGGSFHPVDLGGFLFMWQPAGTRTWNTLTGPDNGDGLTEYLVDAINLITANQGSANGNEFFVNNAATNIPNGEGYVIDDVNKYIKYWNPAGGGEDSVKVRMFGAGSETGLRHDIGEFTEVHAFFAADGYGTSQNFRKDNNNVEHKLEGGNKWKQTDKYNSLPDGTGTQMNDAITPDFLAPVTTGKSWMFAMGRDLSDTYASVNADVPGIHADGPKRVQWIGEIASGNTWADVYQNDTLNESIVDSANPDYDFSPAYIDILDPRSDNGSNPKEFYYNEGNGVHLIWYANRLITLAELQNLYNWLNQNFG